MDINQRFIVIEGLSGSGKTTQAKRLTARLNAEHAPAILNTEPTKENPMPFGKLIRQIIEGTPLDRQMAGICIGTIHNLYAQLIACIDTSWETRTKRARAGKLFSDIENKLYRMAERADGVNLLDELELQILYLIDRMFDLVHTVIPKTEQGYVVVQDRFELSTFAYGGSRGLSIEDLWSLQAMIAGEYYRVPAVTVIFKVSPEVAAERLRKSGKPIDRFEESVLSLTNIDREYSRLANFVRGKHLQIATKNRENWFGILSIDANRPEDEVFEELWRLASGIFLK